MSAQRENDWNAKTLDECATGGAGEGARAPSVGVRSTF